MQVRPFSPQAPNFRSLPPESPAKIRTGDAPSQELSRDFPRPAFGLRPRFGLKLDRPVLINRLDPLNAQGQGMDSLVRLNQLRKDLTASARVAGLDPYEVSVYVMPEDTHLQMAARNGYLERYPHWSWGQEYYKMKMPIVMHGIREIREVVVNNDPVHAYLSDATPDYARKILLIHAIARSDFYRNNLHFKHTDRRSVDMIATHARRIKDLEAEYGKETVESFIDKAHSIRNLIDTSRPPRTTDRATPPSAQNPERDVMAYIIQHSQTLAPWQKDVLEMIRQESYAQVPVQKTAVMADGWACLWNEKLNLQNPWFWDLENTTREAGWTARLFKLNPVKVNSYKLGYTIFKGLEDALYLKYQAEPGLTPQEIDQRVRKDLLRIRQTEQDTTFINKYLTKDMVEALLMYTFDPKKQTPGSSGGYGMGWTPRNQSNPQAVGTKLYISSQEYEDIKEKLIAMYVNAGQPVIEIVNGNFRGHGELYLRHIYDNEDLKKDYADKTLTRVAQLWGRRVHLETVETDGEGRKRALLLTSDGRSITRRNLS